MLVRLRTQKPTHVCHTDLTHTHAHTDIASNIAQTYNPYPVADNVNVNAFYLKNLCDFSELAVATGH